MPRIDELLVRYFEDFNDNLLVIDDIDTFEHLTVLASTELAHDLIIILISTHTYTRAVNSSGPSPFDLPPLDHVQFVVIVFAKHKQR